MAAKATLVEYDDVIEAFATNCTDQAFYVGTLPGCIRCGQYLHELEDQLSAAVSSNELAVMEVPVNPKVNQDLVNKLHTFWEGRLA